VGCWEVSAPIATGSWGSVYSATRVGADGRDHADGMPDEVALKFLPTGTVTPRQLSHLMEMARRELRLYAAVAHERLVRLFETLVIDDPAEPELDGATVLAMELAPRSLADLVTEADGPVPDAPRLIVGICEGLAHLHAQGWVHGDLKPSNVLVMADGSVRLADFGLATEMEGTHGFLPPAGSTDYMPPERSAEPLSERGAMIRFTHDIWALGVTANVLLTGCYPFHGASQRSRAAAAAEYAAGRRPLTLSPQLPSAWQGFIADCLAADHGGRREHHAAGLLARAGALATAPSETPEPPEIPETREPGGPARRGGRSVRRFAAIGALGMALLLTGAFMIWRDPPSSSPAASGAAPGAAEVDVAAAARASTDRWLKPGAGIPERYQGLIIEAGTMCDEPGVSPALVAAMLMAESGFDPNLSDPAKDEYGIARWTPRVLQYYLPPGRRGGVPTPPFSAEDSIPAVGRYLCRYAPALEQVPGERPLLLAAAYRTSDEVVRKSGGVPERLRPYTDRVREYLIRYSPAG
jgi:serine/threonine protein kinase